LGGIAKKTPNLRYVEEVALTTKRVKGDFEAEENS